jgi:hypothetical protein
LQATAAWLANGMGDRTKDCPETDFYKDGSKGEIGTIDRKNGRLFQRV